MKRYWSLFYLLFIIIISSCAQTVSPVVTPDKPGAPAAVAPPMQVEKEPKQPKPVAGIPLKKDTSLAPRPTISPEPQHDKSLREDEQIFLLGLQQVEEAMAGNSYAQASQTFNVFLADYPESPFRRAAVTLLELIKSLESYPAELSSLRSQNADLLAERQKIMKENESLKKNHKALQETYQAQENALKQEIEKLKKDLQQLKNLELQLDKREKMLR